MHEPHPGACVADRYRLERPLGAGGMGSVWAAQDEKLRRPVAIKLMTKDLADSKSAAGRFRREAMAVARLRSPHIVEVHDFGLEDGNPYIVMELLEGEDLRTRLARRGRLPLREAAQILLQAAKGLMVAHRAGIVHRDLKPGNIFLVCDQEGVRVKVVDFGVAKVVHDMLDATSEATRAGTLLGTPRYMSPEQAHGGKTIDHRSDIWSLAVIAYVAITGKLPFEGTGMGELLSKIIADPAEPPSAHDPTLGPELDALFERAFAKDPNERFQSARAFAVELAAIADVASSLGDSTPHLVEEAGMSERMFEPGAPTKIDWEGASLTEPEPGRLPDTLAEDAPHAPSAATGRHDGTITRSMLASDTLAPPARLRWRWLLAAAAVVATTGASVALRTADEGSDHATTPAEPAPPSVDDLAEAKRATARADSTGVAPTASASDTPPRPSVDAAPPRPALARSAQPTAGKRGPTPPAAVSPSAKSDFDLFDRRYGPGPAGHPHPGGP